MSTRSKIFLVVVVLSLAIVDGYVLFGLPTPLPLETSSPNLDGSGKAAADTLAPLPGDLQLSQKLQTRPDLLEQRGLIRGEPNVSLEYVIVAPYEGGPIYLVNKNGQAVHSWSPSRDLPSVRLGNTMLGDGSLVTAVGAPSEDLPAGAYSRIERIGWDGNLIWNWSPPDGMYLHHDLEFLHTGNLLLLAWESLTREDLIAAGVEPEWASEAGALSETIIEVDPHTDEIVWQWRLRDHLGSGLQAFDVNERLKLYTTYARSSGEPLRRIQLFTGNAISYTKLSDKIAVTFNNAGIVVLDHSTPPEETSGTTGGLAGQGGAPLLRWLPDNEQTLCQGAWTMGPEGERLIVFENGTYRGYSRAVELSLPHGEEPGEYVMTDDGWDVSVVWSFEGSEEEFLWSPSFSGVQRLMGGHTLLASAATGRLLEISNEGRVIWEYRNPFAPPVAARSTFPYRLFTSTALTTRHPALTTRTLEPLDPQPHWLSLTPPSPETTEGTEVPPQPAGH